jgi:hypothetical protein
MEGDATTFREQAWREFRKAFGEPDEVLRTESGAIYRWILKRDHNAHIYLTFDSPELPSIAHVMVSDPKAHLAEPVASLTMRTLDEVKATMTRIKDQWKNQPQRSREQ